MKKRIFLLITVLLMAMVAMGCSDKLEQGYKYMEKGDLDKAEAIFSEILASEDGNFEAYEGLISIYKKKNLTDKMAKVFELALSKGYTPKDDSYYMDVFNYYKELDDTTKLENFVENIGDKELPEEAYEELILSKHPAEKGEIIDTKYGDVDGDGKNEMMVLSATESDLEQYDVVNFRMYEIPTGKIKYEDEEEMYSCYVSEITVGDFTQDGLSDVHYTITMLAASNSLDLNYIVSFQGGEFINIYNGENIKYDVDTALINGDALKVFSNTCKQSYYIGLSNEMMQYWSVYQDDPTWWRGISSEIVDLGDGNYTLKESFEVTGIISNADVIAFVEVEFEYKEGIWQPKSLNATPANGMNIIKTKEGEEYDEKEHGLNLLLGKWNNTVDGITYELGITEDSIFLSEGYGTGVFEHYEYRIASYDMENRRAKLEPNEGNIDTIQIAQDNLSIDITATNGYTSKWIRR